MPYIHMIPDPGMNYTLNRPLLDGTSATRLKEIGAVAHRIRDYESWHTVWLELATRAEAEKRWADAASYYHGAEFYLPAGDARNKLYDDFKRNWTLAMQGVAGYEPIAVPYPDTCLDFACRPRAGRSAPSSSTAAMIHSWKSSTRSFCR
jgi:hypothetical protein